MDNGLFIKGYHSKQTMADQSLYKWEEKQANSWDNDIQEDAAGNIINVRNIRGGRSSGYLGHTQRVNEAVRRGLIRYMVLAIDCSATAAEKDYRPNRITAMKIACERFIFHFFDQNPISQLCLSQMQDGIARKLTDMSGNPKNHVERLRKVRVTKGLSSLQNTIKLSILALRHVPSYGHRELLILFSSLSSTDPSNIDETIKDAKKNNIKISIVCLTAEIFICKKICESTGGTFSVAVDNKHLVELLEGLTSPSPEVDNNKNKNVTDFVYMGFPRRIVDAHPCYVFNGKVSQLADTAYICPRCFTKTTDLPTQCNTCTLQLNSSSHIARSFHHIYPVPTFENSDYIAMIEAANKAKDETNVNVNVNVNSDGKVEGEDDYKNDLMDVDVDVGDSSSQAQTVQVNQEMVVCSGCSDVIVTDFEQLFRCPKCKGNFCTDCDQFIHDTLHNCPGCH
jgi:transcription initiation factor TFIIH subunit 2